MCHLNFFSYKKDKSDSNKNETVLEFKQSNQTANEESKSLEQTASRSQQKISGEKGKCDEL